MRKMLAASVALFLYAGAVQAMTPAAPVEETAPSCGGEFLCSIKVGWVCFPVPHCTLTDYCDQINASCPR